MNDELPKSKNVSTPRRPLEERLAHRPDVLARLHELADTLDQSVTDDCTADEAEERVSAQVRQLAQELLVSGRAKLRPTSKPRCHSASQKPFTTVKKR